MSTTTTATTTPTSVKTQATYEKRLEGVKVTDELLSVWKDFYSEVHVPMNSTSRSSNDDSVGTKKEALSVLKQNPHPNQDPKWVPLDVVEALRVLVTDPAILEQALTRTCLVFTPAPEPVKEDKDQRRFRQRMDRLRLQHEETKYVKLTNNLQQEVQDDITAKSMTYAASVGLNMIVAPLSFGCFMYFFAGGVFDYCLGEGFSSRTTGGTDIKRVIVGVISGVVMLFIEMTLFVIRTHEVELHTAKKNKKKKAVQPFGVYSKQGNQRVLPIDPLNEALFGSKQKK